jgi:hypothetical protein
MNVEKISAYLDGQLSEHERAAFEAHVRSDAALHRQVEVTRFAIRAAQLLPAPASPRSFMLPASMAQPERTSLNWRMVSRIGSAFSAVLFVVLIGLDVGLRLQRPALQSSSVAAPIPKAVPQPTLANTPVTDAPDTVVAESVLPATLAVTQLSPLPQAPRAPQLATNGINDAAAANAVATLPQARATKSLNSHGKLLPTLAATAIPTALQAMLELTPAPTLASVMPTSVNPPIFTWPRALAGVVLALGALLGWLGWRRP